MSAYVPRFTTFQGGLYEMELTRSAINSFATHVSKLLPEVNGTSAKNKSLKKILQFEPNPLMDTSKYLSLLATAFMTDNNVIVAPLYDEFGAINGFYPLLISKTEMVDYQGQKYFRYDFGNGKYGAIEVEKAGRITQMQYRNDLFGESNAVMQPTMALIDTQRQGIIEGVKSSASLRFMAKLAMTLKPEDIKAERERFKTEHLSSDNTGGVLLFDQKYQDIKQIDSKPFVVDAEQTKAIKDSVYDYFGTNEHILRNNYTSSEWNAYYEGKIEPFAIQLSLVHTNIVYSDKEKAYGNQILFTANRLQYLDNSEKLNTVTQLFDRGFITHNQGLEIFNMAPIEGGDIRYIRKEYGLADNYEEGENDGQEPNGTDGEKTE